jgi:hypothetical protein
MGPRRASDSGKQLERCVDLIEVPHRPVFERVLEQVAWRLRLLL